MRPEDTQAQIRDYTRHDFGACTTTQMPGQIADPAPTPEHVPNFGALPQRTAPVLLPPPQLAAHPHTPPQPPPAHVVPQPPPVHAVPVPPKPKKQVVRQPRPQRHVQQAQPANHHDTASSAAVVAIIGGVIAGSVSRSRGPTYHRPTHSAPAPARHRH